MNSKQKILTVKINHVVGSLYLPSRVSKYGVIVAKGGPSLGDNGKSPLAEVSNKYATTLFIPDYIGYCRSDGVFNFRNCIETLLESQDFLEGRCDGTDINTGKKVKLNNKEIILIGSSWGGAMVPFIDKYKKSGIQHIGLIKAVTDWKTQGSTRYVEENVKSTNQIILNYWDHIYRGYEHSEWPKIFIDAPSEFNPIENINLLKNKHIYLVHGKQDRTINWRKTRKYEQSLRNDDIEVNSYYIADGKHDDSTTVQGLDFILDSIVSRSI